MRAVVARSIPLAARGFSHTAASMQRALDNLKENPYFEKYAARIAELQQTSPEEFVARLESAQKHKQDERNSKFASVDVRQYSSALNPKESVSAASGGEQRKLNDILKLELVTDKDSTEIAHIWEEYHKHKEVISASIPRAAYLDVLERMKQFSTFLFPLPRSQGYEFIVSQVHGHSVHFTPLLAYQVHKENAPECLTMVHYTELADKGVILMRGDYDKNVLNGQEAQCLANQFQMYYNGKDAEKSRLLKAFTEQPESFKHMDLIAQLENITLV